MKIWRSVDKIHTSDGLSYRLFAEVKENGDFTTWNVVDCDDDAIAVCSGWKTTVFKMGYNSVEELLSKFKERFKTTRQFKLI